jgi:hypothetical protein
MQKRAKSPFEIAGPLTETLLMANLAIQNMIFIKKFWEKMSILVQQSYVDNNNMKITNFDEINQFVKKRMKVEKLSTLNFKKNKDSKMKKKFI